MPRIPRFGQIRKKRKQGSENLSNKAPQKNILRKLNPPPKRVPEDEPEPEVEPEVKRVPSLSQSIEVTGPRSCRRVKCAFSRCPNGAPSHPQHNDGVTFFRFPRLPGQDSKWARRVARANGDEFWPRLTSRVCQLHFPPDLITTDAGGAVALRKGAVPTAEPYRQGEIPNIEEVLLPKGDINEQCESSNHSKDLVMNLEIDDENPEVKQAVASLPPPENGIKLQCLNVNNATVHYLSVDKDYTVNHTQVNINTNNIATLHYVDNKNTDNNTLKCSNLNEDQLSTSEALVNPNVSQTGVMKIQMVPTQNDQENGFGIKINSKLVGGKTLTPDEEIGETTQNTLSDNLDTDIRVTSEDRNSNGETIQNTLSDNLDTDIRVTSEDRNSDGETTQNTLSDNLDTDIRVTSEDCNSDGETVQTIIIGEAGTFAGIQTCDDDFDETVVVKMEYESDSDND